MLDFCTIQVRSQADYPTVGAAADYCAASRQASTACAANRHVEVLCCAGVGQGRRGVVSRRAGV